METIIPSPINLMDSIEAAEENTHADEKMDVAINALIDIRDSTAYDATAKARASIALERLGIK